MSELKKGWLTLDKDGGSGNGTVVAKANQQNTGRNSRSTTVTFTAADCTDVVVTPMQKGKPETTAIQGNAAVVKAGGTVTLTGTSNSKKLTFGLGTGDLSLTLPQNYTANGVSTNNGANIIGDPGATAEYNFSIQFNVAENTTIEEMSKQVIVTDDGGNTHTCTITIAAGDAYLDVTPTTIELEWDGSDTKNISVSSNTTWTVKA